MGRDTLFAYLAKYLVNIILIELHSDDSVHHMRLVFTSISGVCLKLEAAGERIEMFEVHIIKVFATLFFVNHSEHYAFPNARFFFAFAIFDGYHASLAV